MSKTTRALAVLAAVILVGCAGTRSQIDPSRAELTEQLPESWAATTDSSATPLSAHFLDLIDDARLQELVDEALSANPDLRAAARRLESSQTLLVETKALRWPVAEGGFSLNRSNQGINDLGERIVENRHAATGVVVWELDVWGRLAALHGENVALTASQAADFAAARDALGARVIQAWIAATSLGQALALESERVNLLTRVQETIQSRYRRGIGTLDDLAAASASTELAKASIVALQDNHDQMVRAVERLLGRHPRADLLTTDSLPAIHKASPGFPADAIAQRNDVAAALWRLQAADASAAAAARALLPSVRLTGDVSKNKTSLKGLLDAPSIWSLAGSLTQPLFQRGLLRARSKARRLEVEAAWEDYRATVLQAVGEIEDGLGREEAMIRERDHLVQALDASARNTDIQEDRYRRGLANITELLLARNQEMDVRRQVLALDSNLLTNRITLALAVGAGFEHDQ